MCGITGFLDVTPQRSREEMITIAATMASTLVHRGPDARGVWVDASAGIGFGHTRLSIVDVSEAGAQPMPSASGRFVLNYNGEIYNAPDIAAELRSEGARFRGHSDTEVLVEAIDRWGLKTAVTRANGMFAFAVWDRTHRRLHLARDRLGEKPLYFGRHGSTFLFGSELSALRAHPDARFEIDRDAIASFLRFSSVPAPWSIYQGIHKLPPGTVLTLDADSSDDLRPQPYWSPFAAYEERERAVGTDDDVVDELETLLRDAVRIRMRSDVPLGAFLSGGIDSSTIVALMQEQSSSPIRTFTIGTTDRTYNEADAAHEVATHLGTRHTELVATPSDAITVIPRLPEIYDEPFSDASQIPTFLVAQLARRDVTVSLSGDGGDETFGGYDRYRYLPSAERRARVVPKSLRSVVSATIDAVPPRAWDTAASLLPRSIRPRIPSLKAAKFAAIFRLDHADAMYRELVTHWDDTAGVVIAGVPQPTLVDEPDHWPAVEPLEDLLMALDTATYLPDDILVKLDRATMAVSLEGRVPLLDHRVVEFGASLPAHVKIRSGTSKWPLRAVLSRHVPDAIVNRPKSGFGIPLGDWLRGPLRPWAEDLLSPARLRNEGYFRTERITGLWRAHVERKRDLEYQLWDVLMFQAWLQQAAVPPRSIDSYTVVSA